MSVVLIAVLGTLFGALVLKTVEFSLSRKGTKTLPSKYDVNYVRQKEMEIWGYYFTSEPEPKPTPGIPEGSAAQNIEWMSHRARQLQAGTEICHCHRCGQIVAVGRDTCQSCTLHVLQERKQKRLEEYRDKQIHRTPFVPRRRNIEGYDVLMPSEVPDFASAKIEHKPQDSVIRVHWKWTDPSTGYSTGLTSLAAPKLVANVGPVYRNNPCSDRAGHELATCDCGDQIDVYADQHERPVRTIQLKKPTYNPGYM